jgi:hypothetical protein
MVSNPGSAPVVDPCGLAGGTPFGTWAPEWGNYVNTTYASHGDYGSKVLPEFPTNTVWKIGDEAEVSINLFVTSKNEFSNSLI